MADQVRAHRLKSFDSRPTLGVEDQGDQVRESDETVRRVTWPGPRAFASAGSHLRERLRDRRCPRVHKLGCTRLSPCPPFRLGLIVIFLLFLFAYQADVELIDTGTLPFGYHFGFMGIFAPQRRGPRQTPILFLFFIYTLYSSQVLKYTFRLYILCTACKFDIMTFNLFD